MATEAVQPATGDPAARREVALAALIDRWTAHMRWRGMGAEL